jgi:threonylcarbamoyladenosine tRNA methylthiotransferase CDKAL1
MARIIVETYGCTLNQAESEIMGSLLERAGHDVELGRYAEMKACDCLIINTCTVKAPTEQRILDRLKAVRGLGRRLVVAGCMASASCDAIARVAPDASIVGTGSVSRIADAVAGAVGGKRAVYAERSREGMLVGYDPACRCGRSVVAKIPISEGCLSACSFCESRFARGPLNSFSEELIFDAIRVKVANGAKEIDLTSQDAGAYGLDRGTDVAELVSKASEIPGEFKIRIGMLNPEHLHRYADSLIESLKNDKVYKFLHLPIQSGSDRVLKDMNRKYTVEEFDSYTKEFRSKISGLSIETDIIVGYPTETDEDFRKSLSWIREARPMMVNVSKFGARPHTRASGLAQLPNDEIKRRSAEMTRTMREVLWEERKKLVRGTGRVLITEKNRKSFIGKNDGYVSVALEGRDFGIGEFVDARITGSTPLCLIADAIG